MNSDQADRVPVPAEVGLIGKSVSVTADVGGAVRRTRLNDVLEKPRSEVLSVTVPKLTQVGEVNILRRARELSLRNSAN